MSVTAGLFSGRRHYREVIDGKVYDTQKAREVCYTGNNLRGRDLSAEVSYLYLTPRGRWFIAGRSGPMGRFTEQAGGGTIGASGILPVDVDEAYRLAERSGDLEPEQLAELFPGRVEEA